MSEKWSPEEIKRLDEMLAERKSPAVIAQALGRPIQGTMAKIWERQREKRAGNGNGPAVLRSTPAKIEVYAMHNPAQLKKMQSVARVCQTAAVSLPAEVAAFFGVPAKEPKAVDLDSPPRMALTVKEAINADGSLKGYVVNLPDSDVSELLIVVGEEKGPPANS